MLYHTQKRWSTVSVIPWCALVISGVLCSRSREASEVVDHASFYVSMETGHDEPSCGSQTSPCRTITFAVTRADQGDKLYIDGSGTNNRPYTCESLAPQPGGIYVEKSISLVGYHSTPHIRCGHGLGPVFVGTGHPRRNNTTVTFENLVFRESTITFIDCSFDIENCTFTGGSLAINVTLNSNTAQLEIHNSLCSNISACIYVEYKGNSTPETELSIKATNMSFIGLTSKNTEISSGLHVVSTVPLHCSILFDKITLKENVFSSHGAVYVDVERGPASVKFTNVIFSKNTPRPQHSLVNIKNLSQLELYIDKSSFVGDAHSRCLFVDVHGNVAVSILDSFFNRCKLHAPGGDGGAIFFSSLSRVDLHTVNSQYSDNSANGPGGCIRIESRSGVLSIVKSHFKRNSALGDSGGDLSIAVSDTLAVSIRNSSFQSSFTSSYGGVLDCSAKQVKIAMSDSLIAKTEGCLGPVFTIGMSNAHRIPEFVSLMIEKSLFVKCHTFCAASMAMLTIAATDSLLNNSNTSGVFIDVTDSSFHDSLRGGNAITANSVRRLFLRGVTVEECGPNGRAPGGGVFVQSTAENFEILIANSVFRNSYADGPGGAIGVYSSANHGNITIMHSRFESNIATRGGGGCLYLLLTRAQVKLENVSFAACWCYSSEGGGALYIDKGGNVSFSSCNFTNCSSSSSGGAISISSGLAARKTFVNCRFERNSAHSYGGAIASSRNGVISFAYMYLFINSQFFRNTADLGGAIRFLDNLYRFNGCFFHDNFARARAGHVLIDGSHSSIEINGTVFLQTQSSLTTRDALYRDEIQYTVPSFMYAKGSSGVMTLQNTTLDYRPLGSVHSLVMVSKGGRIDWGQHKDDYATILSCSMGSQVNLQKYTDNVTSECTPSSKIAISIVEFSCQSCPNGYYSLERGQSKGLTVVGGFRCLPCPYGADCSRNIAAKENFWGYKVHGINSSLRLEFIMCPLGYCRSPKSNSLHYNSCQGNRMGTLCGRCREGYSENLISPSCTPTVACNDAWVWSVGVFFVLLMALYLIVKPPIFDFLLRQVHWISRTRNWSAENREHEGRQNMPSDTNNDGGYLKIIFYFYQVADLLLISNSYSNVTKNPLVLPVLGLFNFQMRLSFEGFLCPFPGLTAVTKELMVTSQVYGVFAMILLCYAVSRAFCLIRCRPRPNIGPYLGAVMEVLLLGYATVAYRALVLVYCVPMGGDSRLFIAGEVVCFQWWQYLLMAFVCTIVAPFILVLALGSWWLHKGTVSSKELVVGCAFPLPFLIYCFMRYTAGHFRNAEERDEEKAYVASVLYGPFRPSSPASRGALYWESVLIGRRLVLIVLHVAVWDALTRQLFLTLACIIFLLHHFSTRPFEDSKANTAETVSLLSLVIIGTLNIVHASFLSLGQTPQASLKSVTTLIDWLVMILLAVVPVVVIVVILVFAMSQIIRLLVKIGSALRRLCATICCHFGYPETRPLIQVNNSA